MPSSTLDKKVNFTMFFTAMGNRLKNLLASALSPEEKLNGIIAELEKQVQEKRVNARELGAQMRAIADPETKELEPLEALKARRAKLVALGGTLVDQPRKKTQLGQVSQQIAGLDKLIGAQQATYDMLEESYNLAKSGFQEALAALDTVRQNGPAMIAAIQAHKDAIKTRDKARDDEVIDTSFLSDLEAELSGVQAELRSDADLDNDLDATSTFNVDEALAQLDEGDVNEALMAEFRAAATTD